MNLWTFRNSSEIWHKDNLYVTSFIIKDAEADQRVGELSPLFFFFPCAAGNDTASDGPWHLVIAQKGEKRADKWGAWQRRDYVEFRGHVSLMCKPSEIPFYCRLGESESLPFNAVEQRSSLGFKICKEVHANIEHCLHYLSSWKVFYQHPARFTFLLLNIQIRAELKYLPCKKKKKKKKKSSFYI